MILSEFVILKSLAFISSRYPYLQNLKPGIANAIRAYTILLAGLFLNKGATGRRLAT